MRVSWGTPSASRTSAACFMVPQSDWLPMMIPTKAVSAIRHSLQSHRPCVGCAGKARDYTAEFGFGKKRCYALRTQRNKRTTLLLPIIIAAPATVNTTVRASVVDCEIKPVPVSSNIAIKTPEMTTSGR